MNQLAADGVQKREDPQTIVANDEGGRGRKQQGKAHLLKKFITIIKKAREPKTEPVPAKLTITRSKPTTTQRGQTMFQPNPIRLVPVQSRNKHSDHLIPARPSSPSLVSSSGHIFSASSNVTLGTNQTPLNEKLYSPRVVRGHVRGNSLNGSSSSPELTRKQARPEPRTYAERITSFDSDARVSLEEIERTDVTLGSGSEGEVLLAVYRGVQIALKHGKNSERVEKEQAMIASLQHPNIIRTFGTTQLEGRSAALFEFCDNGTLEKYVEKTPTCLGTRTFDRILEGVLEGLIHMHQNDVLHMDVKGENILLTSALEPKLADFGYACKRIKSMPIRGTKAYMSPEICLAWACNDGSVSRAFTPAADVYSFGMMLLYYCNKDKHAYVPHKKFKKWWAVVSSDVAKVTREYFTIRDDTWQQIEMVSPKYLRIISKCLQFDPAMRPSASKVLRMLQE